MSDFSDALKKELSTVETLSSQIPSIRIKVDKLEISVKDSVAYY